MSGVTILDRITANWVRLTRFIGIYPGTPYDDQEGQLRYHREGNVNGTLYVARHLIGGTYEWMVVSNYTDEMARDAIGTALVAGNNIDITVSDVGNTITIDVEALTSADISDFAETARDTIGTALVAGNNIDITVSDGSDTITIDVESLTSADITDFATAVDERARDAVGTALVAGNNIDITVSDVGNTITIDVESLTSADITDFATAVDERARDAVGTALVAGNNIDISVVDGSDTITIDVETLTLADISDVTATATEVNYTTNVTSDIQTQINGKVSDTGDEMTGALVIDVDSAGAFTVEKADETDVFNVNTTSARVDFPNGTDVTFWAGNYASATTLIDGSDGSITAGGTFQHTGSSVGFYNTGAIAKPTVSGSRGGNAALADLLTELANLGLITNSTSA
jgi:hypothetical protein